jgi:FAD synthase
VEFITRLRGEQRLNSFPELVAQIHTDIAQARSLLPPPVPLAQPFFHQSD